MKFLRKLWKKLRKRKLTIVLDVSALRTQRAMKILEEAPKVVLLTGTIKELDKYKNEKENFGENIRFISRKSREDEKSEKYICVAGYEKESYQDYNIIEYCRKNKNTIILTNDNNLCNMAKAYEIPYIFPKDEELQNIKDVVAEGGKLYLCKEKQPKDKIENKGKEEPKKEQQVKFYPNYIKVKRINNHITCMKVVRNEKIISIRDYKEEDILYVFECGKKHKCIKIKEYRIKKENGEYVAKEESENVIWYINEIFKSNFPEELKDEIWKFYIKNSGY